MACPYSPSCMQACLSMLFRFSTLQSKAVLRKYWQCMAARTQKALANSATCQALILLVCKRLLWPTYALFVALRSVSPPQHTFVHNIQSHAPACQNQAHHTTRCQSNAIAYQKVKDLHYRHGLPLLHRCETLRNWSKQGHNSSLCKKHAVLQAGRTCLEMASRWGWLFALDASSGS